MNPDELKFWLDWYEALEGALLRCEGSVVAYRDPDGELHHAVDEAVLPVLHQVRELFLQAGTVDVFCPREPLGTQVWPACWEDEERAAPLIRLVEEPAYLAQDGGFRAREPEAPSGLRRLLDLMEAREFCRVVSRRAGERCAAWPRIVPELFRDGLEKVIAEALPSFDLLPRETVDKTLAQLDLPREAMSPFLPYVDRRLSLARIVRTEELVPDERQARRMRQLGDEWVRGARSTREGDASESDEDAAPSS